MRDWIGYWYYFSCSLRANDGYINGREAILRMPFIMLLSKVTALLIALSFLIGANSALLVIPERAKQHRDHTAEAKRYIDMIQNAFYGSSGTFHQWIIGAVAQMYSSHENSSSTSPTPASGPEVPPTPANSPSLCRRGPGRRPVSHSKSPCKARRPASAVNPPGRGSPLDWTQMATQFDESYSYTVPDTCHYVGKEFKCSIPIQGHVASIVRLLKIYSLPINIRLVDRGPYGVYFDLIFSHETVMSLIELFDFESEDIIADNIKLDELFSYSSGSSREEPSHCVVSFISVRVVPHGM